MIDIKFFQLLQIFKAVDFDDLISWSFQDL